jgi:dihydroorotase
MEHLAGCFPMSASLAHLSDDGASAFMRAANGIIGLETSLGLAIALVHKKIISPRRLAEMMCASPARLMRMEAAALSPQRAADVTIVDPNFEWTVEPARFLSKSRNTPFAGIPLRGKAMITIVGGEIVYDARGAQRI